ncbi:MAG: DUF547 domain-containing protein [Chitinophagaceae bacterium]|nr:DUF547 domain-containing protein [Chitinophagaceae bacterium]
MKLIILLLSILAKFSLQAQTGYMINDMVNDFPISKVLNSSATSSSFNDLNDRLLIVDFFGTWCVPCVKALPKLSALQRKYKEQIRVVLVSNEPEEKLAVFMARQKEFILSLVVDEQQLFTNYFQPPSYPYTVIIDKNGKVVAIPTQEEITEDNINQWLSEEASNSATVIQKTVAIIDSSLSSTVSKKESGMEPSQNTLIQLSQEFMYAAKTGEETSGFINRLQQISMADLQTSLSSDDEKKACWINLYNAYTQVALKNNPEQYKKRGKFFGNKFIQIAGHFFSLDDIEHGILRRSKIKWSLGHLSKLFPNKTEKALRVEKLDYRLHFALNCGAKSCPPIAFYKSENIHQQLDLATSTYLKSEVEYDEAKNVVKLPTLMSWFRRDFGGKKKMIALLHRLSLVPAGKKPKITFKSYDWTLYLQNYKS